MKELIERIESLTEGKYDPRRIFGGPGSMRLVSAFQVLGGLPVRGVSKSDALKVVGKMTGLRMPSSLRVPSEGKSWRLEDWLDWLAEWAEASGQMEWAEPYAWAVPAAKRKGFYPDEAHEHVIERIESLAERSSFDLKRRIDGIYPLDVLDQLRDLGATSKGSATDIKRIAGHGETGMLVVMERMREAGLIQKYKAGSKVTYAITPAGVAAVKRHR